MEHDDEDVVPKQIRSLAGWSQLTHAGLPESWWAGSGLTLQAQQWARAEQPPTSMTRRQWARLRLVYLSVHAEPAGKGPVSDRLGVAGRRIRVARALLTIGGIPQNLLLDTGPTLKARHLLSQARSPLSADQRHLLNLAASLVNGDELSPPIPHPQRQPWLCCVVAGLLTALAFDAGDLWVDAWGDPGCE